MNRLVRIAALAFMVMLVAAPALAQETGAAAGSSPLIEIPATFGPGLIIIGAAYGIGRIGSQAVEAMARQPEVVGNIQTAMIISAALVEGATFFALIICLLALQA